MTTAGASVPPANSSIPLVDLTSRPVKTEEMTMTSRMAGHKTAEMNGKAHQQLMDLTVSHLPPK